MNFGGICLTEPFDGFLSSPGGSAPAALNVLRRYTGSLNCLCFLGGSTNLQSMATRVRREQTAFKLEVHNIEVPYQVLAPTPFCKRNVIVALIEKKLLPLAKLVSCLAEHSPIRRTGPSSRKYVEVKRENAIAPTARQFLSTTTRNPSGA